MLGEGFALSTIRQPDARFVARLGAALPLPAPGSPPPAPLYLRAPDAKLPGGRELVTLFAGDAATLAALHALAFERPWDAAALRSLLAGPGVFAFAASSGFVLARAAAGEAEILTLAGGGPRLVGRGLGCALDAGHRDPMPPRWVRKACFSKSGPTIRRRWLFTMVWVFSGWARARTIMIEVRKAATRWCSGFRWGEIWPNLGDLAARTKAT